jgi:hypothetical protein
MIALFENEDEIGESDLAGRMKRLVERERCSRNALLQRGENLREDLLQFLHARLGIEPAGGKRYEIKRKSGNLTKHAMAVVLALSVSGTSSCLSLLGTGVEEYAPPPLEDTDGDGLYNGYEWDVFKTSSESVDTDDDGIPDGEEDHDGDGITNWEYQVNEETPLIGAIRQGHIEEAFLLMAAGADDPNAKDARGGTALIAAAEIGNTKLVEALLDIGAEVNAADNTGNTALMIAEKNGHAEVVDLLRAAGAQR